MQDVVGVVRESQRDEKIGGLCPAKRTPSHHDARVERGNVPTVLEQGRLDSWCKHANAVDRVIPPSRDELHRLRRRGTMLRECLLGDSDSFGDSRAVQVDRGPHCGGHTGRETN